MMKMVVFMLTCLQCFAFGQTKSAEDSFRTYLDCRESIDTGSMELNFTWKYNNMEDKEVVRQIHLIQDSQRFRITENSVNNSGRFSSDISWNGELAVRQDYATQSVSGDNLPGSWIVTLDQEPQGKFQNSVLESALQVFSEKNPLRLLKTFVYDEVSLDFAASLLGENGEEKLKVVFHMVDLENFLYSKKEMFVDGMKIHETVIDGWKEYDGLYFPVQVTNYDGNGKLISILQIQSIDLTPDLNGEDFIVNIPYSDKWVIYNEAIREYLPVTKLNKEVWEKKRYMDAFYMKFHDAIGEAGLEDIKETVIQPGIEDGADKQDSLTEITTPEKQTEVELKLEDEEIIPDKPYIIVLIATIIFAFILGATILTIRKKRQVSNSNN